MVKLSDTKLLELARQEAKMIFEQDPLLSQPENEALAVSVYAFWSNMTDPS
jgi:hypothetical protein